MFFTQYPRFFSLIIVLFSSSIYNATASTGVPNIAEAFCVEGCTDFSKSVQILSLGNGEYKIIRTTLDGSASESSDDCSMGVVVVCNPMVYAETLNTVFPYQPPQIEFRDFDVELGKSVYLDTGFSRRFLKSDSSIDYIFTNDLCNCVGIAVHTKTEFGLMHAFPEEGVRCAVDFVRGFSKEDLKIALISAQYTSFLNELYTLLLKECDSIPLHCIGSIELSEKYLINLDRTSIPLSSIDVFNHVMVSNRVCINSAGELSQNFSDETLEQYKREFGCVVKRYKLFAGLQKPQAS